MRALAKLYFHYVESAHLEVQVVVLPLNFLTDMLAAVAFAVSGSLVASRKGLDVLGFMWLALITGVGGGTVRDLLLGLPIFWVVDPSHAVACLLTAIVMFFVAPRVASRLQLVLWFDALGLALVVAVGTAKGMQFGSGPLIAVIMGVMTGCVGGILRDVIGGEVSVVMRREVYVTAAAMGSAAYVMIMTATSSPLPAAIACVIVTFSIRGLAMTYNWRLPSPGNAIANPPSRPS